MLALTLLGVAVVVLCVLLAGAQEGVDQAQRDLGDLRRQFDVVNAERTRQLDGLLAEQARLARQLEQRDRVIADLVRAAEGAGVDTGPILTRQR